ncbi:MAG: hypothetical protein SH821_00935 [Phototrophicales bacterium]|nr:hypothetical protein [Phototrophicales bacterium]
MLKIVHTSKTHLILKDQRRWASLFAGIFTLISIGALVLFVSQIAPIIESRYARDGMLWVMVTIIFFLLIGALVVIGGLATWHFGYGIHCHFDRIAETLTIQHIGVFCPITTTYAIYAIDHIEIQKNTEMATYGVFLVMKSGEHIPLVSFYKVDEEEMMAIINEIRTFLRG